MKKLIAIFPLVLTSVLFLSGTVDEGYTSQIKIQDFNVKRRCLEGKVQNTGTKTVLEVQATVTCHDAQGRQVHTEDFILFNATVRKPLKPQTSSEFHHCVSQAPDTWRDVTASTKLKVISVTVE